MKAVLHIFPIALACLAIVPAQSQDAAATKSGDRKVNPTFSGEEEFHYPGVGGKNPIKIYWPEDHTAEDKRTAMIFFHGGGWGGGDYSQGFPFCEYFKSRGIVAMTAAYTLTPSAEFKGTGQSRKRHAVMDAKTVVRWVRHHAEELGVDPSRLVVVGNSAGGHIGLVQRFNKVLQNPNEPGYLKNASNDIAAAILLTAAFTPEPNAGDVAASPDAVNIFGYIEEDFPPTLHLIGETDGWAKASVSLVENLKTRKQPVEGWLVKGAGHNFMMHRNVAGRYLAVAKMEAFLKRQGLIEGEITMEPLDHGFLPERIAGPVDQEKTR